MNQEELENIKIYTIHDIEKSPAADQTDVLLSTDLIEEKLSRLESRLPPDVISELEQNLKKVMITEKQCDEIIERVIQAYESVAGGNDLEKIHQKLNELDNYVAYFQQYLENQFQKPAKGSNKNADGKWIETDIISVSILLKWIEFLLSRTGEENMGEAVQLYLELGWIDEALGNKMLLIAKGLAAPQNEEIKNKSSKLSAKDHIQSLIFIERLKAIELVEADLLRF